MIWVLLISFIVLCLIRVPVAFSLLISSTLTIWFAHSVPLIIVPQRIWVGLNNFPLLAVPFFLFVGQLMNAAGISHRLIDFSRSMVGHFHGGLAHVNVVVSMLFAGISGVSSADTLGVGSVMIPAMEREHYPKTFGVALTAASSTLGNVIPPSLMMIIYSASAGVSVGGMFLAGVVPGVLIGLGQIIYSYHLAKRKGVAVTEGYSTRRVLSTGYRASLPIAIPVIIIGGIIGGIFTATEASVIAVLYSLFLAVVYGQFVPSRMYKVICDSVGLFALSLLAVAAASVWAWILAYYNIPQSVVATLTKAGLLSSTPLIFLFVILIFLVIGTFMDAIPAIIILQPVVGAITHSAGIDPYHIGVVIVLTLSIGLITPPYGLCLLIAADLGKVSVFSAMRGLIPFYAISMIVVILAAAFPQVMLALPRWAMPQFMG